MNIRIKATNITLTSGITDYVNKSLGKIDKFVSDNPTIQCDVELSRTNNHHKNGDVFGAEIHIVGEGIDAYARVEHDELNFAINDARDEIVHKLHSIKGKKLSYMRRSGAIMKAMMKGVVPWGERGWYKRGK